MAIHSEHNSLTPTVEILPTEEAITDAGLECKINQSIHIPAKATKARNETIPTPH